MAGAAARAAEAVTALEHGHGRDRDDAFSAVGIACAETLIEAHRVDALQDVIEPARAALIELLGCQ
jgi:hypothetical protein